MDKIRELAALVFGSCLVVDGPGRTYAKLPLWLAAVCALASVRLAVLTAVLVVALGMRARIVKR